MDLLTSIALKQKAANAETLPIKFWEARLNGKIIGQNNSIPLLRYKFKGRKKVTFHAIR